MSLRITQSMIYDNYVSNMQSSLGAYMNTAEQGSTQKKINSPSDDPAGMYKVLNLRNATTFNEQLLSNCDTAKGWLTLEDSVLSTQMPTVITSIKELAEQASTGTYTAEQRRDIAYQVRQQFGSLLNMANTEFDGKSLFAGHKYDSPAFQEGVALMSKDSNITALVNDGAVSFDGNCDQTIAIQFLKDGTLDDGSGIPFRWTDDGGETWHDKDSSDNPLKTRVVSNECIIDCNGVSARISLLESDGTTSRSTSSLEVKSIADPNEQGVGANDGTTMYVRPAAFYQGDVNGANGKAEVTLMGTDSTVITSVNALGPFSGNTLIRFEEGVSGSTSGSFKWAYSVDNGMNWVEANANYTSGSSLRLPLPEGYVDLEIDSSGSVPKGAQLMVHPEDADMEFEIMKGTYIAVNGVGKDIFGGYYEGKPALLKFDQVGNDVNEGRNLFEVVGNFIAYLETNDQDGCQETLAKLTKAEEYILTQATRVGGLENRVDVAYDVLTSQKLDIKERLSYVEDIDLTELLVKMQRQQITYQTVLQSASKIMNLSLANYL